MGIALLVPLIFAGNAWRQWDDETCAAGIVVLTFVVACGLATPFFIPYDGQSTVRPAVVDVSFDEFITIKAVDWPIRTSTNIKYSTKPVQIRKTDQHNAWGMVCDPEYSVEIVPMAEEEGE